MLDSSAMADGGSNVFAGVIEAGDAGPVQDGTGSGHGTPGAMAAPPPGRRASDCSGAYGGVDAHEATKLRSREAQRKVRLRQKVGCVCVGTFREKQMHA